MTSLDMGKTWQYTDVGTFPNDCWGYRGIAYGNGLFVGITATGGYGRITTSPDGIHWRNFESTAGSDGIVYGGGMFVTDSFTSTDGYNFKFRNLNVNVGNHEAFAYINGQYIVSGSQNGIAVSPDAMTFAITLPNYVGPDVQAFYSNINKFAVGNGIVVGVSYQRIVSSSDDGKTWTNQDNFFGYGSGAPASPLQYDNLHSVMFDGKQFVIYGGSGNYGQTPTTWKSNDGVHWTMSLSSISSSYVAGDPNSHLVGFTSSNSFTPANILTSLDFGATWAAATSVALSTFYDFSTPQAPIADPPIAAIGSYHVGQMVSGIASSDPSITPVLPASVEFTHAKMLTTACGPNLPEGR